MSSKKPKTKPLSLPAFRRVVDDYRRIAMPRGQNLSDFLRSRAIAPIRFYPTFLTVYRDRIEDVFFRQHPSESEGVETPIPDMEAFINSISRVFLTDANDEDTLKGRDMIAEIAQRTFEKEYLREKIREKQRDIEVLKQINEEYAQLEADIVRNMEERKEVENEITRIYDLAQQDKATPEEIKTVLSLKARIDRDTDINRRRLADLRRRRHSLSETSLKTDN